MNAAIAGGGGEGEKKGSPPDVSRISVVFSSTHPSHTLIRFRGMALPIVDASHTRQSSLWRNDSRCILGTAFWSFLTAFVFYFNFLTLSMGGSKKKKARAFLCYFSFLWNRLLGILEYNDGEAYRHGFNFQPKKCPQVLSVCGSYPHFSSPQATILVRLPRLTRLYWRLAWSSVKRLSAR